MALIGLPIFVAGTLIGLIFGSAEGGFIVAALLWAAAITAWAFTMLGFLLTKGVTKAGRAQLRAEREQRQNLAAHWMDR